MVLRFSSAHELKSGVTSTMLGDLKSNWHITQRHWLHLWQKARHQIYRKHIFYWSHFRFVVLCWPSFECRSRHGPHFAADRTHPFFKPNKDSANDSTRIWMDFFIEFKFYIFFNICLHPAAFYALSYMRYDVWYELRVLSIDISLNFDLVSNYLLSTIQQFI